MVQVYANGAMIHDTNVPGTELLRLEATVSVKKAGTAEIVMPAGHPAFDSFVSRRTEVTIYRSGRLLFRGRALDTSDDFDLSRTVICEGERGFLRDAVLQPYLYQADPRVIFSDVIRQYNAQVDDFKKFEVGAVTVTDPNGYIRIQREDAELVSDTIDALVERVGGFITFDTDSSGRRVINWLATLDGQSARAIIFGDNLLDYARVEENDDFATVLYPYGKKDEETGERVSIEKVNDGKRYVVNEKARAVHGWIAAPVYWDDVTLASNLKTKAEQELALRSQIISSLELSAVDYDIGGLEPGDNVPILSEPHGVDGLFLLYERRYDLLDPAQDSIVLGKDVVTLTRSTATAEKSTATQLRQQTGQSVSNTYIVGGSDESAKKEHASEHALGGSDQLHPGDIGALDLQYITDEERLIQSGDDMNDYIAPGVYRCATTAIASTLSNITSYTSAGFRLIVTATSSTKGCLQHVIFNTKTAPRVYWRVLSSDSVWGEWYRVATDVEITDLDERLAALSIGNGIVSINIEEV